jgi:hypothetical protein
MRNTSESLIRHGRRRRRRRRRRKRLRKERKKERKREGYSVSAPQVSILL